MSTPRTPETGVAGEMNKKKLEVQSISENAENESDCVYDASAVPETIIDSLAREFLPQIREFYSKEENRKAFEEWKRERNNS